MTEPPIDIRSAILAAARDYRRSSVAQAILEPHEEAIILLRAKSASYEKVVELLADHGVIVSTTTLRRFCRRHATAIRRARASKESPLPSSSDRPPLPLEIGART
ncbi:MAG TPA: hypothetical protein VIM58_08005, partial [Candidatus Methylacidiphilales bacterium]